MPRFNPSFLIAVPQLGDPNFLHGIVLMLEHDEQGALGLVINDPTGLDLGTFSKNHELLCHETIQSQAVMCGGPVEPTGGWILHSSAAVEEKQELMEGLYLSGSQETLQELLAAGYSEMRLLLGYAGWGASQLEEELAQGAWLSAEVQIQHIFETPAEQIWRAVLRDLGVEPSQIMLGTGLH